MINLICATPLWITLQRYFPTDCYNLRMKKVITKATLHSQPSDLAYWLAQPVEARFAALEMLRQQAHAHIPDAEQRLQRVYSVTQLKKR